MKFLLILVVVGMCTLSTNVSAGCGGGAFKPSTTDCNAFYRCVNGDWIEQHCQQVLHWNSAAQTCDWPDNAGCTADGPGSSPGPSRAPEPVLEPSTGGEGFIFQSEFNCAARTKGGNPDTSYYNGFIKALPKADITTKEEAAKFLAHAVWETVGFQYTKEVFCQNNLQACVNAYPNNAGGLPGKVYYGRGMLQVTWDYNYKAASQALYGDNRLIQNPDQAGDDPAIGWATAAWFWKANVHSKASTFGATLKAINGALECDGGSNGENRVLRFNNYKAVLRCLNMPAPPDSDGACSGRSK